MSEEIVRIVKSETHSEDEDIVIDIDSDREDMVYTKRSNLINALHLNGTEPHGLSFKSEITDSMDTYKEALDSYKEPFSLPSPTKDTLVGLTGLIPSNTPQITALGLSGDSVLIKDDSFNPDPLNTLPNIPEMDTLEPSHTISSSDDSGFLPSSLGTSDLSPSDLLNETGAMSAEAKVELLTPTTMGSICRSSSSPDLHYLAGGAMLEQSKSPLKYNPGMTTTDSSFAFIGKMRGSGPMLSGRYSASEGGGGHDSERFHIDELDNTEASSGESETDEHPNGKSHSVFYVSSDYGQSFCSV